MPEHESWCCRSPESPCAIEGGCSGSCNCGADESIEGLSQRPARTPRPWLRVTVRSRWWTRVLLAGGAREAREDRDV